MMRAPRVAGALIAFLAVIGACTIAGSGEPLAAQAGASRAVVIVDTGSGVHTSVIEFGGSIRGLDALTLAKADPVTITYGSLGQAVCQLYGVGDPAVPGECPGGWAYYRAVGGAIGWTASGLGASNTVVHDGDVEGWRYGGGPPPFSSFCEVVGCAPPPTDPPPATAGPTPVPGPAPVTGTGSGGSTAPAATSPAPTGDSTASSTSTTGDVPDKAEGARRRSRNASIEVAAGPGAGGGDSGSPTGVIVAAVVLAGTAAAAVWFRRRRRGPAPG